MASDPEEREKLADAITRWQRIRIEQFGFVTNLLIGLAAGLIAVEASAAFGKLEAISSNVQNYLVCSMSTLLVSITVGIILAWNRLADFRQTFRIVRLNQDLLDTGDQGKRESIERDIKSRRNLTDHLGDVSRALLVVQSISFLVGVLFLLCSVLFQTRMI